MASAMAALAAAAAAAVRPGEKCRGDRALTDRYMFAGAEPLHLQNLSESYPGE